VIDFVIPGFVLRYSVLGVHLSFGPGRHRSHLLRVAGNADVLGSDVEYIAWGQLRVGKERGGLLGENNLSEKEKGEGARKVRQ
jgi:hypothetical protein